MLVVDAVDPNGIQMLLADGLSTFVINAKTVFSNGLRSLPRNPPVFGNFILADESLQKPCKSCKPWYLSISNNLSGKLVSSLESPITIDHSCRVSSVALFIANFNLLSCECLSLLHLHYCIAFF